MWGDSRKSIQANSGEESMVDNKKISVIRTSDPILLSEICISFFLVQYICQPVLFPSARPHNRDYSIRLNAKIPQAICHVRIRSYTKIYVDEPTNKKRIFSCQRVTEIIGNRELAAHIKHKIVVVSRNTNLTSPPQISSHTHIQLG